MAKAAEILAILVAGAMVAGAVVGLDHITRPPARTVGVEVTGGRFVIDTKANGLDLAGDDLVCPMASGHDNEHWIYVDLSRFTCRPSLSDRLKIYRFNDKADDSPKLFVFDHACRLKTISTLQYIHMDAVKPSGSEEICARPADFTSDTRAAELTNLRLR